jgi:hypothetical protein
MRTIATRWLSLVVCLPGLAVAQSPAKDADSLALQVLSALAVKNQQVLESLSIDQTKIKKYIWPTVASRVSSGTMNAEKFAAMYSTSSRAALTEHLTENGGKKLELVKVSMDPPKQYKGYRLLPNPEVTVRSEDGQEQTLKLGSALLEREGTFRVASYYRAPTVARPKR